MLCQANGYSFEENERLKIITVKFQGTLKPLHDIITVDAVISLASYSATVSLFCLSSTCSVAVSLRVSVDVSLRLGRWVS